MRGYPVSVTNGTGLILISRSGQGRPLRAVRSVGSIHHPQTSHPKARLHPSWKAGGFHFHTESCRTPFRTALNRSEAEIANGRAIPANSGFIPCHSHLSHSQRAAEAPCAIVGLRTVVIDEYMAEAAVAEERAADLRSNHGLRGKDEIVQSCREIIGRVALLTPFEAPHG